MYYIHNYFFSKGLSNTEAFYKEDGKTQFGWEGYMCQDNLSLSKDIKRCHKAIIFIESLYFYIKVKYLLSEFNGVNDIIKNICFIYFERSFPKVANIRCKLQIINPIKKKDRIIGSKLKIVQ